MASWSTDRLKTIAENADLFVSPFREDGTTYGTPTQTWALVVDGNVYVRAANGRKSRWYQAAITHGAGRVRVAGQYYDVKFEAAGDDNEAAIDAAYEAKYPGSSAAVRPRRARGWRTELSGIAAMPANSMSSIPIATPSS